MENRGKRKTAGLKLKIAVCLVIVIVVLIVKKIDGHEDNRLVSAIAEYYGKDYSVGDVVDAMSEGIEKAESIPDRLRGEKSSENDSSDDGS